MKRFELGEMLMTCGIADEERSDRDFAMFVNKSIERHGNRDAYRKYFGRQRRCRCY